MCVAGWRRGLGALRKKTCTCGAIPSNSLATEPPSSSFLRIPFSLDRNLSTMSLPTQVDTLVIGAGPTGLGAAKRLHQLVSQAK